MKKVWVLINTQAGWDCITGVYDSEDKALDKLVSFGYDIEDAKSNDIDEYYIHEEEIL